MLLHCHPSSQIHSCAAREKKKGLLIKVWEEVKRLSVWTLDSKAGKGNMAVSDWLFSLYFCPLRKAACSLNLSSVRFLSTIVQTHMCRPWKCTRYMLFIMLCYIGHRRRGKAKQQTSFSELPLLSPKERNGMEWNGAADSFSASYDLVHSHCNSCCFLLLFSCSFKAKRWWLLHLHPLHSCRFRVSTVLLLLSVRMHEFWMHGLQPTREDKGSFLTIQNLCLHASKNTPHYLS